MKYIVNNLKSNYYGCIGWEVEQHTSMPETWIKIIFDYVETNGQMVEKQTWFQESELEEYNENY